MPTMEPIVSSPSNLSIVVMPLDLDEVSFLDRRCRIFLLAFPEEHFDRDAVRKVRDIEDHEFVSARSSLSARITFAADHNLADLTVNIVNIYRIAFKIAPKQNIRILRFPVRDPSVGTFPEAAGKAAFSLLAESLLCKTAAVLSTTGRLSVLVSAGLSCRIRLLLRCSGTRRRFSPGAFYRRPPRRTVLRIRNFQRSVPVIPAPASPLPSPNVPLNPPFAGPSSHGALSAVPSR